MARLRVLLMHRNTHNVPSRVFRADIIRSIVEGEYLPVATSVRETKHAPSDSDLHSFMHYAVEQSQTVLVNWWTKTQLTPITANCKRSTAPGDLVVVSIDDDLVLLYAVTHGGFLPL